MKKTPDRIMNMLECIKNHSELASFLGLKQRQSVYKWFWGKEAVPEKYYAKIEEYFQRDAETLFKRLKKLLRKR